MAKRKIRNRKQTRQQFGISPVNTFDTLEARRQLLEQIQFTEIVPAPRELGLPEGARIGVKAEAYGAAGVFPTVVQVRSEQTLYSNSDWRYAKRRLVKECERHDIVEIEKNEYQQLQVKAFRLSKQLPAPFCYGAFNYFTVRLKLQGDIFIDVLFAPSSMRTYYQRKKPGFIPKVDFIEISKDETVQGCFGFSEVVDNLYVTGIHWYNNKHDEDVTEMMTDFACTYFVVQNAHRICKERIVEVKPTEISGRKEPSTSSGKTTNQTKLNTVELRRVIRIGGKPAQTDEKKGFTRHTDCWYVRGCERHYKSGKVTQVKGTYKGPLRNDPEARRRTKKYIADDE